ncbi:MAG: hypothetical protein PHW60_01105 [Kiritimatiellae bacterium]|nr:hypothetical protein [Kiritimatiellia bacterium]
MNFISHPANSYAKMAGLPANRRSRTRILPFSLPEWQETQATTGWKHAARHFGAIGGAEYAMKTIKDIREKVGRRCQSENPGVILCFPRQGQGIH